MRIPRMLDNFGECLHAENGLDPLVRALLTAIGGGNLASSRSSGAAERYQYVLPGSTWPSAPLDGWRLRSEPLAPRAVEAGAPGPTPSPCV